MSSFIVMSIRKSRPRVIQPEFSQLMVTHAANRSIWRCARYGEGDKAERIPRNLKKFQQYPICNQQKSRNRHGSNAIPIHTHSSWSWAAWHSQSRFSDLPSALERRLWNSDSEQIQKRMELLKSYIEADPYRAVFGRRLDPIQKFGKNDTSLNGFLRSLPSMKKSLNVRPRIDKRQKRSDNNHAGLQYDPISGRMVPMQSSSAPESSNTKANLYFRKAIDYPPGTEIEAKLSHNPNLAEDGHFQPGNKGLGPETRLSSQSTVDCLPGSELDALFTLTSASRDTQGTVLAPRETERKPYVNIDCPPETELDTLFVSDSISSVQPQSRTSNVDGDTDGPNVDDGWTAGTDVECSPGSELEAKFISDPTSCSAQNSRSGLATQSPNKQIGISIDCPPGNDLDAQLSSDLASLGLESAGPVHQTTNATPMTNAQESFEYSPGSNIEVRTSSKLASRESTQSGAHTCIDCSSGSELEATFACNLAPIEELRSQPTLPSSTGTSKIAKNTVDCTPGNELQAKSIAKMVTVGGFNENEDLGALDATGIRSHYAPSKSEEHVTPLDFDASEDRIGDVLLSQDLPTEKGDQPAPSTLPKFYILAFDTSTLQVTAVQADSFFGVDEEDSRPNEILSRLHNPAKFLPYFEKIQEDGYEIATGGGNILVFRKSQSTPRHTFSDIETDHNAEIHAEIAKHLRHDSVESAATYAGDPWQSTTEPSSESRSSSFESEPTIKFESSFYKTSRRMFIAGTATAAACYAIGVMADFFRTGGKDGRGIDGFTVFESDRRRQE
ncbi:hypothetical protein PENCOP_c007G03135 [Penicillium coprophilum]|uniref:Uncharacterized protein n=1 Tax=Penicillium coprophilum TaxID=36646 RepID=A0A1V6UKV2_9EURO|nr:hypothetical protein PENCOP_c007G03135 [Penicillium coprophilum]